MQFSMKQHKGLPAGFTLVEIAIVLVVGGIMLGTAATMLNNYLQQSRMITTQQRMQDIDNALVQYVNVNGVLPCVARLNDKPDSTTFGVQIPVPAGSDCYSFNIPGATFVALGTSPATTDPLLNKYPGKIVMGAVPVRTLNLPDQEMTDAWGDRFLYAVTDTLTVTTAGATAGEYDPTQGAITVKDASGNAIADPATNNTGAQYVIVSYGADRVGAYTIAGVLGLPCAAGTAETQNCTLPTKTFVKTLLNSNIITGPNKYDDYVTFRTQSGSAAYSAGAVPSGMIAPFMLSACPPGWKSLNVAGVSVQFPQTPAAPIPGPYTGCPVITTAPPASVSTVSSICCQKN